MGSRLTRRPEYVPFMIVGWGDAGFVGTGAIEYLEDELSAELIGEIDLSDYILMPKSRIEGGVLKGIEFPKGEILLPRDEGLILFKGETPHIRQMELAREIVDLAIGLGVRRIYTVGAFQAPIHHSESPRVLGVVNREEIRDELTLYGVELDWDYHGTTSMNGLILALSKEEGIEGVSLWGEVPNYLSGIPNPKVIRALLSVLSNMLRLDIDFDELDTEVGLFEERINDMIDKICEYHPEFRNYLDELKREKKSPEIENLLKEIEDFLRGGDGR